VEPDLAAGQIYFSADQPIRPTHRRQGISQGCGSIEFAMHEAKPLGCRCEWSQHAEQVGMIPSLCWEK
jgi:hypothetical protein